MKGSTLVLLAGLGLAVVAMGSKKSTKSTRSPRRPGSGTSRGSVKGFAGRKQPRIINKVIRTS